MLRPSLTTFFLIPFFLFALPTGHSREAVSGKEVTGTFQNPQGSTLEILALGRGKLKIHFLGIYPYEVNGQKTANLGEAEGIAGIRADRAVFKPKGFEKACTLKIFFAKPGEIQVTQEGDPPACGFGRKVRADGTYGKTSDKKPDFTVSK